MTREEQIKAVDEIHLEYYGYIDSDFSAKIVDAIGLDEDKLYDILTSVECEDENRNLSPMYALDKVSQSKDIIKIRED